ncbi:MAG: NifU family protein [Peptostreptococcales bacterium]|jgi:Fe-S cluster biogenesis protein NfuA
MIEMEKIYKVLDEKINPELTKHFGSAEVTSIEDGIVAVKFYGACSGCPSIQDTLENVVKSALMGAIPEIKDVVIDRSVDDLLVSLARGILDSEKKGNKAVEEVMAELDRQRLSKLEKE